MRKLGTSARLRSIRAHVAGTLLAVLCISTALPAGQVRADESGHNSAARADAAALVKIGEVGGASATVALSPDGRWVLYSEVTRWLERNSVVTRFFARAVAPHSNPVALAAGTVAAGWSRDGNRIAAVITSGGKSRVAILAFRNGGFSFEKAHDLGCPVDQGTRVPMRWSPDSARVILLLPQCGDKPSAARGFEGGIDWADYERGIAKHNRLIVYEISRDAISDLAIPGLDVGSGAGGFDLSPDGNLLAVTATRDPNWEDLNSALVVFDLRAKRVRTVADAPGRNMRPFWSPDGRKIIFQSDLGTPVNADAAFPAVVDLNSGHIQEFANIPRGEPAGWGADGTSFYWRYEDRLGTSLAEVELSSGKTKQILDGDQPDQAYDTNWSFSAHGDRVAFVRSTPITPADLYVETLDPIGQHGPPLRLTNYAEQASLGARIGVQIADWRSKDGKFLVHGLLFLPNGRSVHRPLPTVVLNLGGPGMVKKAFEKEVIGLLPQVLAESGYAVLVPNTRGRGGYGDEFLFGLRDGHSYVRLPFEDAEAGLDMLIQTGVSDPGRVTIAGHSYGGYLSAYAITQTDRFRAAAIWEDHREDLTSFFYYTYDPNGWSYVARDIYGVIDPYDHSVRQRLLAESPGFNADRVKTPTLLLFGAQSYAGTVGQKLYLQYRHFGVPSELIVYDEGHIFEKPASIVDAIGRTVEWIDRWSGPPSKPN